MPTPHQSSPQNVRIWDLPTRVFHWALVLVVLALAVSGLVGGAAMAWHFRFGYTALALLLFRFVWGFIGGRWSRFGAFVYNPASVLAYLRGAGKPEHAVGHSPLGAASVFAMLGLLAAQVATGLFSDDEIAWSGPLTRFVSNAKVSLATAYHADIGKWLLLAIVVVHIGAIIFYERRKRRLVHAMIHGDKVLDAPVPSSRDDAGSRLLALVVFAASVGVAVWVASLAA